MARAKERASAQPRILRTVRPGAPGTMGLLEEFGERLVCVRYRYDEAAGQCFTTAEIVVRRSEWAAPKRGPSPDEAVWVKVEWGEPEVAKRIKAAGGKWNRERVHPQNLWVTSGSGRSPSV